MTDIFAQEFEFISVAKNGNILEVTINRPESYNSLHGAAHRELETVWNAYEEAQDLWCAILTGAGEKAFCSGNDLKTTAMGGDISAPESGFAGLTTRYNRHKPIIAAVNGIAMGGGLEIVLACDIAIAAPHSKVALPEVKVGLFAGAGGVQRIVKMIGHKAAMEMLLTGRHIMADEAVSLGIVNSVADDAMEAARAKAAEICAVSPSSVKATKKVLNQMDEIERLADIMNISMPMMMELMQTEDFQEGIAAFAQKRAPAWKNK